ncbi:hypothetical protein H072_7587 [Dactylellina haptotyla CBS 200.50]|uniref:RING-type domain-containing protein n=1 Tax=Dactylellina haptotyla (strain CBS 200.50) TaxID=1284197 RepID=S8A735_DACHA|nr:hypothetical protein H072_7587 [Dactylellina haptotyla CBS 200.50]
MEPKVAAKRQLFEFTALPEEGEFDRLKVPRLGPYSASSSVSDSRSPASILSDPLNSPSYSNAYGDPNTLADYGTQPAFLQDSSSPESYQNYDITSALASSPGIDIVSSSPASLQDVPLAEEASHDTCIGSVQVEVTAASPDISNTNRSRGVFLFQIGKLFRVFNNNTAKGQYIGAMEQVAASTLVTIMDEHDADIEGYISPLSKLAPNSEGLWISVDVYCNKDNIIKIGRKLAREGLYLETPCHNKKKLLYSNPHILKISDEIKYRLLEEGITVTASDEPKKGKEKGKLTVEERLERKDEVSNLFTTSTDPEVDSMDVDFVISSRIATPLKEHQISGVRWMLKKEGCFDVRGTSQPLKGGILADDMGMGKSLTTLALVATSLDYPNQRFTSTATTTLLICPKSVVTAWEDQVSQHTNQIRYLVYHPSDWKDKSPEFQNYDLVITTFGIVTHQRSTKASTAAISQFQWRRIILDEAHVIRERSTKQAKSVFGLRADFRWCITGTPVQNKLDDYGSLLEFIQYKNYDDRKKFQAAIIKPMRCRNPHGLHILTRLISDTTLRRLKLNSSLNLPPRKDLIQKLPFNDEEATLHKLLYQFTKDKIENAVRSGAKGSGVGSYITQLILRLRQVCNHGADLLPPSLQQELRQPREIKGFQFAVSSTFDRMICEFCKETESQDAKDLTTFDNCQHVICKACDSNDEECPLCDRDHFEVSNSADIKPSTKVEELMKNINNSPSTKKVVFSCWTKMLDLVELALVRNGIGYTRLEGSLNMSERRRRIFNFKNDPGCSVFLATLGSGSVGLDLTVASEVHLLEPQFNPMLEEQALARVHRIGQTDPVTTIRYIMQNSYEEQILDKQNKKLQLAELCVSGTVKTDGPLAKYLECLEAVIN